MNSGIPSKRGGANHIFKHRCADDIERRIFPLYQRIDRQFTRWGWWCDECGFVDERF